MTRARSSFPIAPWSQFALRSGEMLVAAGQVIPVRLARIAAAGGNPDPRDRREFALMGNEKMQAGAQSMVAAAMTMQKMQLQWWSSLMQPWWLGARGRTPSASAQAAQLASAMLTPIHRTATANARRLTKVKPSRRAASR